MGQYCFARGRLSSSVVVCNAWTVGAPAARREVGRAADIARRASSIMSRLGDTSFYLRRRQLWG